MKTKLNIYFSASEDILSDFSDILPEGMGELGGIEGVSALGVDRLISEIVSAISEGSGKIASFFLLLFGVSIIISLASLIRSPYDSVTVGGVAAVSAVSIFYAIYPLLSSVSLALEELNSFFTALVPIIISFLTLGGCGASAASASVGMQITLWVTGTLGGRLLPPIVAAMFATSATSALGGGGVARIARGIKNGFMRLVGIGGALLGGIIALQSFISVSADGAALRAAKFAAGGLVPVVGSTVTGALSTLSAGLSMASGVIGGGAVGAILLVSLSPLALLFAYKLCFFVCQMFLEFAGRGGGVSCISAFSSALDALIGVYTMTIIVYILEIIAFVIGGASVIGGLG